MNKAMTKKANFAIQYGANNAVSTINMAVSGRYMGLTTDNNDLSEL